VRGKLKFAAIKYPIKAASTIKVEITKSKIPN
jgi:hypothetical protein